MWRRAGPKWRDVYNEVRRSIVKWKRLASSLELISLLALQTRLFLDVAYGWRSLCFTHRWISIPILRACVGEAPGILITRASGDTGVWQGLG